MKMPLNYAILKYFTTVDEASVDQVMKALRGEYGDYKAFKKAAMTEAVMTAESNALVTESRFELDDKGDLQIYYSSDADQKKTINSYIN